MSSKSNDGLARVALSVYDIRHCLQCTESALTPSLIPPQLTYTSQRVHIAAATDVASRAASSVPFADAASNTCATAFTLSTTHSAGGDGSRGRVVTPCPSFARGLLLWCCLGDRSGGGGGGEIVVLRLLDAFTPRGRNHGPVDDFLATAAERMLGRDSG